MPGSAQRFVIDPDGEATRLRRDAVPDVLAGLVDQELGGPAGRVRNQRVEELAEVFGFGFEPWAEPGHLRMLPHAARMHASAEAHARLRARQLAACLQMPFDEVSGVLLVDTSNPALSGYLDLIHADPSLYGAEPYALSGSRDALILRQTSCLEKYAIAHEWDWERTLLPRCLFEVSDSFRAETDQDVEQLFRLRRFRLPEAHLYHDGLPAALETARVMHVELDRHMRETAEELVILVSASHDTWRRHRSTITSMLASTGTWALLVVSPPGGLCQDGVELDFEYKSIDAVSVPRELITFQIDTRITEAIGLAAPGRRLSTTHLVPAGSVERLIHAHLDRVARLERNGTGAVLPDWLTPVTARFIEDRASGPVFVQLAAELAGQLEEHGLGVEIDDRPLPIEEKVADADRHLVPWTVSPDDDGGAGRVLVRGHTEQRVTACPAGEWLAGILAGRTAPPVPFASSTRLTEQPHARRRAQASSGR